MHRLCKIDLQGCGVKIAFSAHLMRIDLDGFVDGPFRLAPSCFNSDMHAR